MKRLNLKLVIGLFVGTLVTTIGAYVVHGFQMRGTAEQLLTEGQRLHQEAKELAKQPTKKREAYAALDKAAEMLAFHLQMSPENGEAADEQALICHEMIPLASDNTELFRAVQSASSSGEWVISTFPDMPHKEVRRGLAELYMTPFYGRYSQAEEHLTKLTANDKDPELQMMLARVQAQQPTKEAESVASLEELIKADPTKIDAYILLAAVLRDKQRQPAQASAVMDSLVEANPDAYRAYLARANFNLSDPLKTESVQSDTEEAIKRAPKEIEVITTAINVAARDEVPNLEKLAGLRKLVEEALERDPNNERLYQAIWQVSRLEEKPEEAQEWLEKGAAKFPDSQMLMVLLADQYFSSGNVEAVRAKVKELSEQKNGRKDVLQFMQARLAMADRKWEEAVKGLLEVRALMPQNALSIDLYLGQLYRILDRPVDAQVVYDRALAVDPKNPAAIAGSAYCQFRQGKTQVAVGMLEKLMLEIGEERFAANAELKNTYVTIKTEEIQSKPAGQQDWNSIARFVGKAPAGAEAGSVQSIIQQVQFELKRGNVDAAKKLVSDAVKANPKNAGLWALTVQIIATEPNGVKKALELVRKKSKELGQPLQLRTLEISFVSMGSDKEQIAADLAKLAEGIDTLPAAEQERLYRDFGAAYQRAGKLPEALGYWRKARKVQPSDSSILRTMFAATRSAGDDALMQEVIKEYRERFGDDSEEVLAAEAARIITLVDEKKIPTERLEEAKKKLTDLEIKNSRSGPLSRLRGEVWRIEGDHQKAIESMRQAVERGERDPVMIATLAHLLSIRGQQDEANQMLEQLRAAGFGEYTDKVSKVQLAVKGEYGPLIETLEQFLERDDSDITKWLDLVTVLHQDKQDDKAEARLRDVVKKFPTDERGWVALVGQLALMGKTEDAEKALAEAKGKVPQDKRLATSAMGREKIGPPEQATKEYDAWLAANPNDLRAMRTATAFHMEQVKANTAAEEHTAAALALLDKMIALGATAPKEDQQFVAWARVQKAQNLAATRQHRDFQEAVKLLDANREAGQESASDRVLRATMFAARQEKVYQREGAKLLQELRAQDLLNPLGKLSLAQLLSQLGEWSQARTLLSELIETQPEDPTYAAVMIKLLLDRKEVTQTSSYLNDLVKKHPNSPMTKLSQARVLIASKKADEGVTILKSMVPRPLPPAQANFLLQIAKVLDELQQTDAAEDLYREYFAARPSSILIYAEFRGRHGRTDAALDLCDTAMARGIEAQRVVQVGNSALRQAKPAATPAQCQRVNKWIDQGLASAKEDPVTLKLMRAELFDLQGKYGEVEEIYRETLNDKNIGDAQRALVGNNLGFLLAMRSKPGDAALDDALKMVNDSVDVLGPTSDLLDTRAMVHLARQESSEAIRDLETSIAEEPSGAKFFHLALAQFDAGQADKAKATFQRATADYGFDASELAVLEKPQFERLKNGLGL